jgi:pentatricopeptide repeat protein
MSFFCKVDKSQTGSTIRKIVNCQYLIPRDAAEAFRERRHHIQSYTRSTTSIQDAAGVEKLEGWLIGALVDAGRCKKHSLRTTHTPNGTFEKSHIRASFCVSNFFTSRRQQHTAACESAETNSRDELLALVDQYDFEDKPGDIEAQLSREIYEAAPGPQLVVSEREQDVQWPPPRQQWEVRGEAARIQQQLAEAVKDRYHDPEHSYQLYRSLPSPRIPYLSPRTRHRLLRNLGSVHKKDEQSMMRYLSIVDDMKANAIPLTIEEWNVATSFAGRYVATTTETEVEAGLRMFREMEHVAGIQANAATFNILFDLATKAGKFNLAEMIYKEMERRNLPYNRFHHVSLIHHYGLKGDGDGVRKAYKALVQAGEIVDTVVLNSVISSFIRCQEPQAALQVYERMKRLYEKNKSPLPHRDYRKQREVSRSLAKLAKEAKQQPGLLEAVRTSSTIAPDVKTYQILIQYLAIHAGDLHTTARLLDEMRWFDVPLYGSIFLALFNGFANHGGVMYSPWTIDRLESVWNAYLKGLDNNTSEQLYLGRWNTIWALRAFAKCSGKDRMLAAWEDINVRWDGGDDDLDTVKGVLQQLIEAERIMPRDQW